MSPAARTGSRRDRPRISNAAIGAAMALAVLVIVFLAFNEGLPFVHGFRIHAIMQSSNQLRPGSPVRIAGVDVGQVTGVSAGPGSTADVEMEIGSNGQPLHRDAVARVRPRVFLEGGFYVDLSPGSPSAPTLGEGGTIPLAQTSIPVQFYQVLSTFQIPTRSGLEDILRELDTALAHGGAQSLRAVTPQLVPTLREVAWAMQGLNGEQPGDVATIVGSGARVSAALARHEAALGSLVSSFATTANALASQDGALGRSVAELDGTLRDAPAALSAVDAATPPLIDFSRAAEPGLRIAPPVIADVANAVQKFGALVAPRERTRLIGALRATFVSFPTLVQRLGNLFPVLKTTTDCLQSHVLPVLNSVVPDGALSTGRPVWQDFVHATVGLASASQNFDGDGFHIRYLGGLGTNSVSTGTIPGVGQLFGAVTQNLQGSRPVWLGNGVAPPFRPDAACASQALPNLSSATGSAGLRAAGPQAPLSSSAIASLRRLLAKAATPR